MRETPIEEPANTLPSQPEQFGASAKRRDSAIFEPVLIGRMEAARMLGLGSTKTDSLISDGVLESVRIGSRRLVKIASVRRLAGIEPDQQVI